MKAQEIGLELPPAVYNFLQGEMLIQNTIAEINRLIKEAHKLYDELLYVDHEFKDYELDPLMLEMQPKEFVERNSSFIYSMEKNILKGVNKEQLLSDVRKKKEKAGDQDSTDAEKTAAYQAGVLLKKEDDEPVSDREVFDLKYMQGLKNLPGGEIRENLLGIDVPKLRQDYQSLKDKNISDSEKLFIKEHILIVLIRADMKQAEFNRIGGHYLNVEAMAKKALDTDDDNLMEEVFEIFEVGYKALYNVEDKLKELREEQDKEKPNAERLSTLEEEFCQCYTTAMSFLAKHTNAAYQLRKKINQSKETLDRKYVDKSLEPLFKEEKDGQGKLLKEAYQEFRKAQEEIETKQEVYARYEAYHHEYSSYQYDRLEKSLIKYKNYLVDQGPGTKNQASERDIKFWQTCIAAIEYILSGKEPAKVTPEDLEKKYKAEMKLVGIYNKIAADQMEDAEKCFSSSPGKEKYKKDFMHVMGDVIQKHAGKVTGRLGILRMIKMWFTS